MIKKRREPGLSRSLVDPAVKNRIANLCVGVCILESHIFVLRGYYKEGNKDLSLHNAIFY